MKKWLMGVWALMAVVCGVARAQDVTGNWQGTLNAGGKDLRLIFKFEKADAGLKGTIYSIDQKAVIPMGAVTVQGGVVKVPIPLVGGSYEGKISADGKTMTGTWKQGADLPLTLAHVTEAQTWPIPEAPVPPKPMDPKADPGIEVATIKPTKPDEQRKAITIQGTNLLVINMTLANLISFGYDLQAKQVINAPEWVEQSKFDITVKPDLPGMPSSPQLKSLTRKLLVERFGLKFHFDKRELAVYTLSVAKTGAKIKEDTSNPDGLPGMGFRALGKMIVVNASMGDFTHAMQSMVLDRPVVDQTGLKGHYTFNLNWQPDDSQFGGLGARVPTPDANAETLPGLFTAIQEQLGMKLDPVKAPVEVMVIDHLEKASDN